MIGVISQDNTSNMAKLRYTFRHNILLDWGIHWLYTVWPNYGIYFAIIYCWIGVFVGYIQCVIGVISQDR